MWILRSLLACAIVGWPVIAAADLSDVVKGSVFKLRAYHGNGSFVDGSAVLVAAARLVTNCHVAQGAKRIELHGNGRALPGVLSTRDIARDLCVLDAAGFEGTVPAHSTRLAVGQKVYAAGFPADGKLTVTAGNVIALHEHDGAQVIQVSAPFSYGFSGGALFDEHGQVAGVLTFKARGGGSFHYAIPIAWIGQATTEAAPSRLPFWQRQGRALPYFLRAASLEAVGNWAGLAELAQEWTKTEPENAGARAALAKAHVQMRSHSR